MTALATLLADRIREDGPISIASFMAECLMHPVHGYYTSKTPFGAKGDFITAPEISQMFGELVGLCLAQSWLDQGSPTPFTLAELGPGRGTLMVDALRATRGVPGFHAALHLVLHEGAPALRAEQARALHAFSPRWIDSIDALPEAPLFLIANEFFDALPIHQYIADGSEWREKVLGLQDETLTFGLTDSKPRPDLTAQFGTLPAGSVVEVSALSQRYMSTIQNRLSKHGGLALIVDYGDWHSAGDTLQAMKAHGFADPLASPGEADLTAHVDFKALAQLWQPCHYTTQGAFLTALGIAARTTRLAQSLADAALENHLAAYRRLTHDAEMGSLFKVLALTGPNAPKPPGFA
jgi:NADH dehydrogenase [ubiquinone] 1 alpha subcomplex assembly factor 7